MDVRRRLNVISENVSAGSPNAAVHKEDPLLERGMLLYQELELSGFEDRGKLEECAKYFLLAAESGSDEAVVWIRTLLESLPVSLPVSTTLPSNTLSLLRWFAKATENEKHVRRVARHMFYQISDGGNPIAKSKVEQSTKRLFSDRPDVAGNADLMKASSQLQSSVTNLLHASLVLADAHEIDEETFVKAALKYAKGECLSSEISPVPPDKLEDFKKANFVKKVFDYPWQTAYYAKHSILKSIERYGVKWMWYYLPMKQLYLLLLAFILPMLNVNFIFTSIFTVVLIIAFSAMCISTLQTINNSEKFSTFRKYSSIFQYFSEPNDKIDTQIPETKLIRKSLGPYITFLVSAPITVFAVPLAHKIPFMVESFGVLAGLFACIVFLHFECWKSPVSLIAVLSRTIGLVLMLVHLLMNYFSIFSASLGEILPRITFSGFPLDINVVALIQVPLQSVLITYCVFTRQWYNLYEGLGPYLLFLVYWVLCRTFLLLSTPLYFLLALAGLLLFCALVPFLPLLLLVSPLIFLVLYGISVQFLGVTFLLLISISAFLMGYKYFNHIREAKWLRIPFEYIILLAIIATLPASYVFALGFSKVYAVPPVPSVTLTDYTQYCTNWTDGNMVQAQLDCLHLQGRMLSASGQISSVKISQVTNPKAESLQSLPVAFRDALTCFLGDTEPVCGGRKDMPTCISTGCHLSRYNLYEFEIEILLPSLDSVSVVLVASDRVFDIASDRFLELRDIKHTMPLHFNATFIAGMGSDKLRLKLSSLLWNGVLYVEKNNRVQFDAYSLLSNVWLAARGTLLFVIEAVLGFTTSNQ